MFDVLVNGFIRATESFKGQAVLTENNIRTAIETVKNSLLEADVEYEVIKNFLKSVEDKAIGQIVKLKAISSSGKVRVSPQDHFIQICYEELQQILGADDSKLNLSVDNISTIMLVGLQGSGKTSTAGKLAHYLSNRFQKKSLLVAADIYRPAAVEQLSIISQKVNAGFFYVESSTPEDICSKSFNYAKNNGFNVIIFDTAGRLAVDEELMQELERIKMHTHPDNIIFVCDAMMGQEAANTARIFNNRLDIDGVIITKLDGDSRGGAALSIRGVCGKPIKFITVGETIDKIEEFRAQGLASRILGMGDVISLMEDFERVADANSEEQALKMLQGEVTLVDFEWFLKMINKMGSVKDIVNKLPMLGMPNITNTIDNKEIVKITAILSSMTKKEKLRPGILNSSRIKRIAAGSGCTVKDVYDVIQRFSMMRKVIQAASRKSGFLNKIPGIGTISNIIHARNIANKSIEYGFNQNDFGDFLNTLSPESDVNFKSTFVKRNIDKDRLKKLRKLERKARKKNRKK